MCAPRPMNTCMLPGSVGFTVSPSEALSVGTSRQPSNFRPSALIWSAMMLLMTLRHGMSRGMKNAPTAYSPGDGRVNPSSLALRAKKPCGICTRMPAPSPARGSAPTAPRCSRLQRMLIASATIWCDFTPLMLAMKPTPQASFSRDRSYMPSAGGRQVCSRAGSCAASNGFVAGSIDCPAATIACRSISEPLMFVLTRKGF
jgi:hypothetical protein